VKIKMVLEELMVLFDSKEFREEYNIPSWFVLKEVSCSNIVDLVVLFENGVGEQYSSIPVYFKTEDLEDFSVHKIIKNKRRREKNLSASKVSFKKKQINEDYCFC